MNIYDLGIIGAGPAGYIAAEKAGKNGLKTVLFDKKYLGGVCLNEGCIPTKTLLYSAKLYDNAREAEKYGILAEKVSINFSKMMERKNKVVKKLVAGISSKLKQFLIEVVMGSAQIEGVAQGAIRVQCDKKEYLCNNLLIATGSEALIPLIPGLDKTEYLTNREILDLREQPKSLAIIGGGVIGIEFASLFASLGTKVDVIEMLDEIVSGMDKELAGILRKELIKKGVNIHLLSKVVEIKNKKVIFEQNNEMKSVEADEILVSVGRKPNINGFGLERLGVELFNNGIKIDSHCRTNLPHVYAAGDVTGFSLLAHTASREAEVAVNHILGKKDTMRYNAIPSVVYTNPEFSGVGLTEEEAQKRKIEYTAKSLPMAFAGRFVAENEGKNGVCKVLIGKKHNELLGVHMLGNPSSEIIYGAALALETEMRITDMQEVVFPHPTVSEIFKETLNIF
ncbi:MAG: dihydrolipoyl dehydrogenase [Bacteroidota bacterium]